MGRQEKEEKDIEAHLRANGWVRKKVAKDGACLFRAFAELHYYSQVCFAALSLLLLLAGISLNELRAHAVG